MPKFSVQDSQAKICRVEILHNADYVTISVEEAIVIDCFKFIVEILAGVASVAGACISVVIYRRTLSRDRKLETIKKVSELRDKYPRISGLPDEEKKDYLQKMEFLCTGINEGVYELSILKKMSGRLFLSQYRIIKPFIEDRRNAKTLSEESWVEYESVMQKLNLLYCCNGCKWRKWFCKKCK